MLFPGGDFFDVAAIKFLPPLRRVTEMLGRSRLDEINGFHGFMNTRTVLFNDI